MVWGWLQGEVRECRRGGRRATVRDASLSCIPVTTINIESLLLPAAAITRSSLQAYLCSAPLLQHRPSPPPRKHKHGTLRTKKSTKHHLELPKRSSLVHDAYAHAHPRYVQHAPGTGNAHNTLFSYSGALKCSQHEICSKHEQAIDAGR